MAKRKSITLSAETIERLERLARDGWYGPDAAGIASRFVEDGVRQARNEGYLPPQGEPSKPAAKPATTKKS
jgi:hypothetical protein